MSSSYKSLKIKRKALDIYGEELAAMFSTQDIINCILPYDKDIADKIIEYPKLK